MRTSGSTGLGLFPVPSSLPPFSGRFLPLAVFTCAHFPRRLTNPKEYDARLQTEGIQKNIVDTNKGLLDDFTSGSDSRLLDQRPLDSHL